MEIPSHQMVAGTGEPVTALRVRVYGLVQGVGFRPFLHRLAQRHGIRGWAVNRNDGVLIHAQGTPASLSIFVGSIRQEAPPLAEVESIVTEPADNDDSVSFEIRSSRDETNQITRVSPDTAVCRECIADMKRQPNRKDYPFVNCTNCGPRFSIVRDLPYDRPKTTMEPFAMCPSCEREYGDIADRRYHAQPNACVDCGPHCELIVGDHRETETAPVLKGAARVLSEGSILAVKGIGGYHLACDAHSSRAVERLRRRKHREGKPLAVMCRDLETARTLGALSSEEERTLTDARRPIVLVPSRSALAPEVSSGLATIGLMLPYTPLHHLLFEHFAGNALVMTSGNKTDEPIVVSNESAVRRLGGIADAFITYNREIHNRVDDSVTFVSAGAVRLIRRSRGWVPAPIALDADVEGIAAMGGELKTCFAVGKGRQAIISQHIGDLKNPESLRFYQEAFERFGRLFRFKPEIAACDLHPTYLSTRLAEDLGIPRVMVQHHHAHIASCLAEHTDPGPVIGVALDGTGYGPDETTWGAEFMVADLLHYRRVGHFAYLPLPGGDAAVREPWRIAVAWAVQAFGSAEPASSLPAFEYLRRRDLDMVNVMVKRGVNSPLSCGAGRYFDAVAALIGLVRTTTFEAEAPMRLEAAITPERGSYRADIAGTDAPRPANPSDDWPNAFCAPAPLIVSFDPVLRNIIQDLRRGTAPGVIAARFHNSVVDAVVRMCLKIRERLGLSTVALSGGVFQNRYMLSHTERRLHAEGFRVLSNLSVPANDGGLCLGQLAVAAARRAAGKLQAAP